MTTATATKTQAKPFIKWVGGKSQLLPELRSRIPEYSGRYIEPFLGGGALFYDQAPSRAILSDTNEELTNAYRVVRDQLPALMRHLESMPNTEIYFKSVREADRLQGWVGTEDTQRAARFIYLLKTCFNGLWRVNLSGHMNTPYGHDGKRVVCDRVVLEAASAALQNTKIITQDYKMAFHEATKNDFVYLDPPYAPVNAKSFIGYGKDKFDEPKQEELFEQCRKLDKRGVKFLMSNSDAPLIRRLYEGKFTVERVIARRSVNSKGSDRGTVGEVLVRNY